MSHPTESKWSLSLPADCSIRTIRDVYALVRAGFEKKDRLEIDCSNVDRADVTSLQLLLSVARTARLEGRRVSLTPFSQGLRVTFQRAGVPADTLKDHQGSQQKGDM